MQTSDIDAVNDSLAIDSNLGDGFSIVVLSLKTCVKLGFEAVPFFGLS